MQIIKLTFFFFVNIGSYLFFTYPIFSSEIEQKKLLGQVTLTSTTDRRDKEKRLESDAREDKFIPTLNHMGYMMMSLDEYGNAFIQYARTVSGPILEIGAAYGVATLAALEAGATVIANDIEPKHLEILAQKVPTHLKNRLILYPGKFPDELDFDQNSLSGALICNVLHFFEGETIELAMSKLYKWLKPGAKVFITADTPYNRLIEKFIPTYEELEKKGVQWPGLIKNLKEYLPEEYIPMSPDFMHFLTPKILTNILRKVGFKIEEATMFARTTYPIEEQLDGREGVGVIARK